MIKIAYIVLLGLACCLCVFLASLGLLPYLPSENSNLPIMEKDFTSKNVVIVGGGLAGMSAAIEAARHGASVTIMDKEKNLGGNSAKATSGINGAGTDAQRNSGVADSAEDFFRDTMKSGDEMSDPTLVSVLAHNSASAIEFLQSFGLNLVSVIQLGGHSKARTHRMPPTPEGKPIPVGFTIVSTLRKYIETELKNEVTVLTNSKFQEVLVADGKAVGVAYFDAEGVRHEVQGNVVLTAGGYANDHTGTSLLEKYVPDLAKFPTTNGVWATGDIIKQTESLGVSLVHMDKVQVHPTGFIEPHQPTHPTKFLAPEALRGCGAILLNKDGRRFINELGRRDRVTEGIFKNCGPFEGKEGNPIVAAMLLSEEVINKFGPPAAGFYKFKKLIRDAGDYTKVAEMMSVEPDVIKQTIVDYNEVAGKSLDTFGKNSFPITFSLTDHFYLAYITPTLHYCMGGIQIGPSGEVMKGTASFPGLYAAGEVSGGVHGNNRLGGNSLLECVVFGRIAGKNAAHK